jgi:hypothetical protein
LHQSNGKNASEKAFAASFGSAGAKVCKQARGLQFLGV